MIFSVCRKLTISILMFFFFPSILFSSSAGTSVFNFLKIQTAARNAAMGGVNTLTEIGSYTVNPAVMPWCRERQLSFQNTFLFSEINYALVTYMKPLRKNSAFAGSLGYLGYNGLSRTIADSSTKGYSEIGNFGYSDILVNLAYGKKIAKEFSYGGSLKTVRENIDGNSYYGFMVSLNGYYYPIKDNWQMSFGISDMGPKVKNYDLPSGVYLGFTKQSSPRLLLAGEIVNYFDSTQRIRLGCEYKMLKTFKVRAGYNHLLGGADLGSFPKVDLTGGFGVILNKYSFDYAWLPQGDLGVSHQLTVNVKLGKIETKNTKTKKKI